MMKFIDKYFRYSFLLIALLMCLFMSSCEEEGEFEEVDSVNKEKEVSYTFTYNNKSVSIGEAWSEVNEKLGQYASMFVAESCAYQGTDRYYYYDDFELMTSEIDGKEILTNIYITKADLKTVNDVCVGMGLSEVAVNLGPADKTTENGLVYYGDKENVQINTRDDKVVSVEYYYVQER